MNGPIIVLSKNGAPLPDDAAKALAYICCKMAKETKSQAIVDIEGITGTVTTEHAWGCLQTMHGMQFHADVTTRSGKIELKFLVPVDRLVPEDMQQAWRIAAQLAMLGELGLEDDIEGTGKVTYH